MTRWRLPHRGLIASLGVVLDVRDKISQEFSSQAGQYDVSSLSNFEIPIYAKSKWIAPLDQYISADTTFNQSDILPPMTKSLTADDGKIYGVQGVSLGSVK